MHRSAEAAAGPGLVLLPAVDVAGGRAVGLARDPAGTDTGEADPLDVALAWQQAGARWIHLVDLDAAFGRGSNAELLAGLVGRLDVAVQLSGGIRDDASLAAAMATGCERVVIGTVALARPDWVHEAVAGHGERVAVGLDVRGTRLAARGHTTRASRPAGDSAEAGDARKTGNTEDTGGAAGAGGSDLLEAMAGLEQAGCARYVVTDVTRDGALTGPNLDLLRLVCARTSRPVVASGGVASLADLRAITALAPLGVEGAIVGKALYAGAFTLPEALAAVR